MQKSARIYVAGHKGMVGSALVRKLTQEGYQNIITATSSETDLRDQEAVARFFLDMQPEFVLLAAARVGGIYANSTYPAQFLYDNLMIQNNVIHHSYQAGVKKLLFLGSSCIYPKHAPQPIKEEYLLSGPLEPTNEAYAIAKIAGLEMCSSYRRQYDCNFISVMPTNLYGPNDNYDLNNSHVLPALLRKFAEARQSGAAEVTVWGSGIPKREFLHADDLADACLFLLKNYNGETPINIGSGKDISIKDLAEMIKRVTGFEGAIIFDDSKPDGTLRKLLDVSRLHQLGWTHSIELEEGIRTTYQDFLRTQPVLA